MFKETVKRKLQDDIEFLLEKHSKEIIKEHIGDALNIMKDIDIALNQLSKILDLPNETYSIKNDWYDILKIFIEKKMSQRIYLEYGGNAEVKHRGTGKTTALLRLSNDYNIPILVKNYEREHTELEKHANLLGLHIIVIDFKMLNLAQFKKHDILLIDEMTKFDFDIDNQRSREYILNNKIIIGFKNNL